MSLVTRHDWGVVVKSDRGGFSATCIRTYKGRVMLRIELQETDELTIHDGDLEVYIALDRLSELPAMLKTFLEEAAVVLGGEQHGAR